MNIQQIGPDRLRILLDAKDLERYNLDYQSINTDSQNTICLINKILQLAGKKSFNTKHCRIIVEVIPNSSNGCILYITKSEIRKKPVRLRVKDNSGGNDRSGYVISFICLNDAIGGINRFSDYPDIPVSKSRFYQFSDKWYLSFEPVYVGLNWNRLISLLADLSEYGSTQSKAPVLEAMLEEHGEIIVKSRAIETFLKFFIA